MHLKRTTGAKRRERELLNIEMMILNDLQIEWMAGEERPLKRERERAEVRRRRRSMADSLDKRFFQAKRCQRMQKDAHSNDGCMEVRGKGIDAAEAEMKKGEREQRFMLHPINTIIIIYDCLGMKDKIRRRRRQKGDEEEERKKER